MTVDGVQPSTPCGLHLRKRWNGDSTLVARLAGRQARHHGDRDEYHRLLIAHAPRACSGGRRCSRFFQVRGRHHPAAVAGTIPQRQSPRLAGIEWGRGGTGIQRRRREQGRRIGGSCCRIAGRWCSRRRQRRRRARASGNLGGAAAGGWRRRQGEHWFDGATKGRVAIAGPIAALRDERAGAAFDDANRLFGTRSFAWCGSESGVAGSPGFIRPHGDW